MDIFRRDFGRVRLSSTCGINALLSSLLGHKMGYDMCDAMRDLGTPPKKGSFLFVAVFFHIFGHNLREIWDFSC